LWLNCEKDLAKNKIILLKFKQLSCEKFRKLIKYTDVIIKYFFFESLSSKIVLSILVVNKNSTKFFEWKNIWL
jgi:hypothetical protein